MAKNRVYDTGRTLSVTSATTASGDPVAVGQLTGVALTATDSDGKVTIDTQGVYALSVKGIDGSGNKAIAVGDTIYLVGADTPKLSVKATGVKFGVALDPVDSAATATIRVKLGKY